MKEKQSLAQRAISSIGWIFLGNAIQIVFGFVRSILLAHLLPVEVFGIYAWTQAVTTISGVIPAFGLTDAFIHRAPETQDEDQAAATQFTLQFLLTGLWTVSLLLVAVFLVADTSRRLALVWITLVGAGSQLTRTPRLILARRVVYRRITLVKSIDFFLSSASALILAWRGAGLWALLVTDTITFLCNLVGFYIWRPVWRPHFTWDSEIIRYFFRFGSRSMLGKILLQGLDRLDDLWTGMALGNTAMGFYSRAYTFAIYPRKILANPITAVTASTYAELKENPKQLSKAFFRTTAFLIRSGFLLAGSLYLVAPEFIHLLLGDKWLPMLSTFRLMLVYTLFDPLKLNIANILIAVGKPEQIVRTRLIQLGVLISGLFLLGSTLGIAGVALTVDIMLLVGIILLLRQVWFYVDFSIVKLFRAPFVTLGLSLMLTTLAVALLPLPGSDWYVGAIKLGVFVVTYTVVLFIQERHQTLDMFSRMQKYLLESIISRH